MKQLKSHLLLILIILTLIIVLPSCNSNTAKDMKLEKTEGTAHVLDDTQAEQAITKNMNLYYGYDVSTEVSSYGWINLDEKKLLKLDESSDAGIEKKDRHLKISLNQGNMFFCVLEELEDDETLDMETPNDTNTSMSIRGTTGILKNLSMTETEIILIEGNVEFIAGDQTYTLTTGQMALIKADEKGNVTVEIRDTHTGGDVPEFALPEIRDNKKIKKKILKSGGKIDYMLQEEMKASIEPFLGTWTCEEEVRYDLHPLEATTSSNERRSLSPQFAGTLVLPIEYKFAYNKDGSLIFGILKSSQEYLTLTKEAEAKWGKEGWEIRATYPYIHGVVVKSYSIIDKRTLLIDSTKEGIVTMILSEDGKKMEMGGIKFDKKK